MPNIAEKIIGTVVQSSAMISAQRHAAVYLSSGPAKPACQPHTIELWIDFTLTLEYVVHPKPET
jgi:hypothetical protein